MIRGGRYFLEALSTCTQPYNALHSSTVLACKYEIIRLRALIHFHYYTSVHGQRRRGVCAPLGMHKPISVSRLSLLYHHRTYYRIIIIVRVPPSLQYKIFMIIFEDAL